ncbi:MAG: universal stress protein [Bacteroidia bacterium]
MSNTPRFLVATDLSDAAGKAIDCATMVAKKFNAEIILFHVFEVADVDPYANKLLTSNFLNREIKKQLQQNAQQIETKDGIKTSCLTKDGELFELIAEAVVETSADMLFVGTHGIKGVQHITGSFIAKAINGANVPVWVVQKESEIKSLEHIFIYVESHRHKAFQNNMLELALKFNAKLHFVFTDTPTGFAIVQMVDDLKKKLDGKTLDYNIHHLTEEHNWQKAFIDLAAKENASLLVINCSGRPIEKYHEEIITNRLHVSVLCLNADEG